ncbi:MAG TPA: hypothetical protein VL947_06980 [Cytophagales bacterium]|nr:hypothetical protein [Cytophagales bacterium]
MKKIIADNSAYSISISIPKNRAYLKLVGFWRSPEVVPEYLSDWKKAVTQLDKGFSLLTDATDMKTHPQQVKKLHEEAQILVLSAGLAKVAEVVNNDITEYQLDSLAEATAFPKRTFRTVSEAENWLDGNL